jgi:arylsulfatase
MVALYDAEIAFNDSQFSLLLARLESRGLDQETVVIFTSDHGEELLDHDDYGHGKTLYRELVQVPLVVRFPYRVAAGTRSSVTAQHIDLLPTIVEMGGGSAPAWAQGRSLLPALLDPGWQDEILVRSYLELDASSVVSLISGEWHLLRLPMDGRHARTLGMEMFDLTTDPAELLNLRARRSIAGLLLADWRRVEAAEEPLFEIGTAEIDTELAARLRDLGYIR